MSDAIELLQYVAYLLAIAASAMLLVLLVGITGLLLHTAKRLLDLLPRKPLGLPGKVTLEILDEGEDHMLTFRLLLPQPGAADVVSRELTVSVGGGDPQVVSLGGDELASAEMSGDDGAAVVGSLVDVDDAGNRSPAREFSFVLADTIAPPQPGEVGVEVTGEQ